MPGRYPCGGLGRRAFLAGAAIPVLTAIANEAKADDAPGRLGVPGPYPGRVVEVRNPAMIRNDVRDRSAIATSVARGMKELTGADDAVGGWRRFFEPGDVVGIKMNPVGNPLANTSAELMLAVIDGLKSAGVKPRDMIVFERYRDEFVGAKMHEAVPDGIAWTGLGIGYNAHQLDIKGDDLNTGNLDRVTGYDPDQFMTMDLVGQGEDPKDERTRRSHLGLLVTRRVNKIVMLPVLEGSWVGGRHRGAQEYESRARQ